MAIKVIPINSNAIEFFSALFEERTAQKLFKDWTELHHTAALPIYNVLATQLASYDEELAFHLKSFVEGVAVNSRTRPGHYRIGRCTYAAVKNRNYHHQFIMTLVTPSETLVCIFQITSGLPHLVKANIAEENTQAPILKEVIQEKV